MTLPTHVVEEDHRLDGVATSAQEALARLRWHWTLDETNPDRVSLRQYARDVGRDRRPVSAMAHGYADWGGGAPGGPTLYDCIELSKLSDERAAAAEAIAQATGMSAGSVAKHHADKVRATLHTARDAAERRGTSVEDEIPRVAQAHERQRRSDAIQRAEDKRSHTMRYVEIEGHLAAAKDRLRKAVDVAHAVDFDSEETELIADMIRQVDAVLRFLDARFTGQSGTDWDAEARRLLSGGDR